MPVNDPVGYAHEFIDVTQQQISGWRVLQAPDEHLPTLVGDCPTCLHRCEVPVLAEVVQGGVPASIQQARPPMLSRVIPCNCRSAHRQPDGVRAGCGRYWLARLTLENDGSYRLIVERDLRLLPATTMLEEVVAGQDRRIQVTAEKWIGGVTTIYGLFSLTGIATGKDALTGIDAGLKWLVAAVLIVGLALAGIALTTGYYAAYGWPRTVAVDTNEKLVAWYRDYLGHSPKAARQLRKAVFFAFGSLAALAVVMLLVWFLPRH